MNHRRAASKKEEAKELIESQQLWLEHGIDLKNRTIMLEGEVDDINVGHVIRAIKLMETENNKAIDIYINTEGGSVYDGLALYDIISNCSCEINTYGLGKIMSMGTVLILAGDNKYCYKNTSFMWHSISSMAGGKLEDVKTETKEMERIYELMLDIYAEKTEKPKTWWKKWLKYADRFDGAEKAKELGFVDEII